MAKKNKSYQFIGRFIDGKKKPASCLTWCCDGEALCGQTETETIPICDAIQDGGEFCGVCVRYLRGKVKRRGNG